MQTQTILFVLDDQDLAALPGALAYLRKHPQTAIWIIHSPQVGIATSDATKDIDAEIEKMGAHIQQATAREDFVAANKFKEQRDAFRIQREKVIQNGWKSVEPSKRDQIRDSLFGQFDSGTTLPMGKGVGPIYRSCLDENCGRKEIFRVLDIQLKSVAPEPFRGEYPFAVVFPGALTERDQPAKAIPAKKPETVVEEMAAMPLAREQRAQQLETMKHFGFLTTCKKHGIECVKGQKADAIRQILDKEFTQQAAA